MHARKYPFRLFLNTWPSRRYPFVSHAPPVDDFFLLNESLRISCPADDGRFLPPSVYGEVQISDTLISDGCLLHGGRIERSVVGLRSVLQPDSECVSSIVMGADYYETEDIQQQ